MTKRCTKRSLYCTNILVKKFDLKDKWEKSREKNLTLSNIRKDT